MPQALENLLQEHGLWLGGLAIAFALGGGGVTVRLFNRMRRSPAEQQALYVLLGGLIGGATIWTTHLLGLSAAAPSLAHGFDPRFVAPALVLAVAGVCAGFAVAAQRDRPYAVEMGGALVGLTIGCAHFIDLQSLHGAEPFAWDPSFVVLGCAAGAVCGGLALHRAARGCELSAAASLVAGLCFAPLIGASGGVLESAPALVEQATILPSAAMIVIVLTVAPLFAMVGYAVSQIEQQVERRADIDFQHARRHDPLTGIPNRVALSSFLDKMHGFASGCPETRFSVLTIDLDRFKEINDMHGHAAGDAVLSTVAARLTCS